MVEDKKLTGKEAYSQVMKDLSQPNGIWWDFLKIHPDNTYAYEECGLGLVLPGGLHFIEAECAHEINRVEGTFIIGKKYPYYPSNNYVHSHIGEIPAGSYRRYSLAGIIPDDLIDEVVAFSRQTRERIKQLHSV